MRPKLKRRHLRNSLITAAVVALVWLSVRIVELDLQNSAYTSGWVLIACITLLMAYQIRKKIRTLPIGSNAAWLQLHLYVGVLTIIVFSLHIDWSLPRTQLGLMLTTFFLGTAITGILGIFLSRLYAKRLRHLSEEIIFERIPYHRNTLKEKAQALVLEAAEKTGSSGILNLYEQSFAVYFSGPSHRVAHLLGSSYHLEAMRSQIRNHQRFLNDQEVEYAGKLLSLVLQKDELDSHHSLQGVLKHWLFIHVPLAVALLPVILIHIVSSYAYRSSL